MNGVLMGGANSNAAMYVRCGGYRNADGTRWNAHTSVRGFRAVGEWCTKGWHRYSVSYNVSGKQGKVWE